MKEYGIDKMTKKRLFVFMANVLVSVAVGYYNLGSSKNDKMSAILSCIVFLLWMSFFVCLMKDKNFNRGLFYKMNLVLAVCFISGICLSQSLVGLLFFWPFIGIAHYFPEGLDERLMVFILYCVLALISFAVDVKKRNCRPGKIR